MRLVVKSLAQSGGVDEVAVVGHANAIGTVHVERLCFCICAAASSRVSQVTKAHEARQVGDPGAISKDPGGHAIALALVEAPTSTAAHDPGSILASVLEQVERIVDLDRCRI